MFKYSNSSSRQHITLMNMRIAYFNVPCLINETCFHGQCVRVNDILIGSYEFCLCRQPYVGDECNELNRLSRHDWLIIYSICIVIGGIIICLLLAPLCYRLVEEDFYPQIIECTRPRPYLEMNSSTTNLSDNVRIYRIPSDYIRQQRTTLDGLVPLYNLASLSYWTRVIEPRTSNSWMSYE